MRAKVHTSAPDSQGRRQIIVLWWDDQKGRVTSESVWDHPANHQVPEFADVDLATRAIEREAWQSKRPGAAPSDERQASLFEGSEEIAS